MATHSFNKLSPLYFKNAHLKQQDEVHEIGLILVVVWC